MNSQQTFPSFCVVRAAAEGYYLVLLLRLILVNQPFLPVVAESHLIGADKLHPAKVLGTLGNDASHFGGEEHVHLMKGNKKL